MTVGSTALSFNSLLGLLRTYEKVNQERLAACACGRERECVCVLTVSGDGELVFQELCHLVDMR